MWVGKCFSFSKGAFSGSMFVFRGVSVVVFWLCLFPKYLFSMVFLGCWAVGREMRCCCWSSTKAMKGTGRTATNGSPSLKTMLFVW